MATLLAGFMLIAAAGTAWRFAGSRDRFAGLEEQESDGLHGLRDTPANSVVTADGLTPAEQLRQLDEQLRADPRNPALLATKIHLGLEYAPALAVEECEHILRQSPGNYFALHHAAMAFLAMTNLDRALLYAARALQARDTPEAHFVVGHVFYAKGDFPNALKHYRMILTNNPKDEAAQAYVEKTERALAARIPMTTSVSNNVFSVKP